MEKSDGGVTAASGFFAASHAAGIKYQDREDMAMIYSNVPCKAAGTFTRNIVKAAPVKWDQEIVANSEAVQAVVINAGIANACTGEEGYSYCRQTAEKAAEALNIQADAALVASTGVIGQQLPMDRLLSGVAAMSAKLKDTLTAGHEAALAIMTTDTHKKEAAVSFEVNGVTATLGGMCKGSGMIHPDMCTMLSFLTTDLAISKELLQEALREDVEETYNMVSVDGDTSTNDTVLLLANGEAGNPEITERGEAYAAFKEALHSVNETLAKQMAGDGEGATALFEVRVTGAKSREDARAVSKAVVSSSLTKAAVYGHDANWGRVLCAMGYSGAQFNPENVDLSFESAAGAVQILQNGKALEYSEDEATKILSEPEVAAVIALHMGTEEAVAWGCDLTHEYININADYRS